MNGVSERIIRVVELSFIHYDATTDNYNYVTKCRAPIYPDHRNHQLGREKEEKEKDKTDSRRRRREGRRKCDDRLLAHVSHPV